MEQSKTLTPLLNNDDMNNKYNNNPYKDTVVPISNKPNNGEDADKISTLNSKSSHSLTGNKYRIPDGGWGWMVVLACLIISMITDGICFSFGLLYVELLEEFKASKSVTSWIGSLSMAVPLLTGPIMSALVDKYGCRKMTIVGGLISTLGLISSSFARTVTEMYLSYGILTGLGLGVCYVTAVVSIAFWFEKKRTLAVSLGACGTGIGTFVFAPFTSFLIHEYHWRGTVLLLAGTFLNICVCGALMRDPDWYIEQNKQNSKSSKASTLSLSSDTNNVSNLDQIPELHEIKKLLEDGKDAEFILQSLATKTEPPLEETMPREQFSSVVNLPTFLKEHEKVPLEVLEQLCSNKRLYNVILENYPSLVFCRSTSEKALHKIPEENTTIARVPVTFSMKLKKAAKSEEKESELPDDGILMKNSVENTVTQTLPATRKFETAPLPWLRKHFQPSVNSTYFKHLRLHRLQQSMVHHGAYINAHKYKIKASSCPNIYRVSMVTLDKENEEKWYTEFVELFQEMTDFSLFCELHFFLLSLSTIILFTWFVVPYFFLVNHMKDFGYTETQASFVLSTIGGTNTIGMILLGWAGDQPWLNVTKTFTLCLMACGISMAAMLFFTSNYVMLVISGCSFGFFLASSFSFTPVILADLVPLDKFTIAYGLNLLCQGIGNLVGPPLSGFLYDYTQSWNQPYYQGAAWIIVSSLFVGVMPYTKNRKIFGKGPVLKDITAVQEKASDLEI